MDTIRCPRCRQDRPHFTGTYCPDCRREYNQAYYRRTPEKNSQRRAGNKFRDVGSMARAGWNLAAIEAEIAKCEVRCANCHRRVTARRRLTRTCSPPQG